MQPALITNPGIKSLTGRFNKHVLNCAQNNSRNVKALLLSSVVLDTYGNMVDYYKTDGNKEVPSEKKPYIKAYKLMNGIVSAVAQVGLGFTVLNNKVQENLAHALFGSLKKQGTKESLELFNKCAKGTKAATTLILATVLVKRLLVPFIVTPLASFTSHFLKEKKD